MKNELSSADHLRTKPERRGARRVTRANRNPEKAGRSWVYFAQAGESGPVKIGQSRQVHTRIVALRAAHYEDVRLIGIVPETWATEADVQWHFGEHRIRGEWFHPHPEILEAAAAGQTIFGNGFVHTVPDEHCELLGILLALKRMY